MSTTVKSLKVTYNPINAQNTFTNGDYISGHVTLEVAKDCQIDSLLIKFKGKAEVRWTERRRDHTYVYHAKDKYFSIKHYFIRDKNYKAGDKLTVLTKENGEKYSNVVAPGRHVYPFTFQVPPQNLPSSFQGSVGKIVYQLETKLDRSMRIDKTDSTKINFVARPDPNTYPGIMTPQHESKDKKMKAFTSGSVSMDVNLEKSGFTQGEGLKVTAYIQNNSSREIKPKYCVYSKISFFARGKRRLNTLDLFKDEGDPIPASASQNVTKVLPIPHDVEPSIMNCNIIKREYRLRVYLDVKYASDPEVKFEILMLPDARIAAMAPPPAASGFGFPQYGNPQYGNPNPPVWGFAPPQPQPPAAPHAFEPPPPYGAHGMYPPLTDFNEKY